MTKGFIISIIAIIILELLNMLAVFGNNKVILLPSIPIIGICIFLWIYYNKRIKKDIKGDDDEKP